VEEVVLSGEEVAALLRAHGLPADVRGVVLERSSGRAADVVRVVRDLAAEHRGPVGEVPVGADALAGLPLLSPGLVDELLGPGAWRRLAASDTTLHRRSDGWYVPVLDPEGGRPGGSAGPRRRAAQWYADHGQLAVAVRWLHACRDGETLAEVLAASLAAPDRSRRWADLGELEAGELEAVVRSWPDDLVRRRPEALLALVRAVEFGMQAGVRSEWLARLERLVEPGVEGWVPVEAELIRELARQGKGAEVHARAERLRPQADEVSRARLLMAESLVDLLHHEDEAVASSFDMLHEATALLRVNGEREWEADAWLSLGFGADYRAGRIGLAVEHIERALALSASGTQMRGRVLTFLAEVLSVAGRPDDAEAALREVAELAAARADTALTAYTAWSAAIVASRRPDLAAAREQLAVVEANRGEWYRLPAGVAFHAEAADILASLGEYDEARAQLEVGRAHPAIGDFDTAFDMAELALEARDGDPARVPELAARCARTPITEWRIRLLEAWAAERGGDSARARTLADQALGAAAAVGHPGIVEAVEPELALWARALVGRSAAASPGVKRRVRLCGSLAVEEPRGVRPPRRGDETTLLAAVAARHEVDSDEVLELLWPGQPDAVSRRRLRNTLNRLRSSVGEVVVRRGDRLALAADVEVDAHAVLQVARVRHTVPELGVEAARRALALVGGELVSGSDPVLDDLRDELGLAVGALADRVADAATTVGELGEAARYLAQARRLDRYDETRAVRLVRVLRALGRDAEAEEVLEDAVKACAELGVDPSPDLTALAAG
jgi:DNA-binding SARP family transcriptional activator